MTQKEKQLLLVDICTRLPYGIFVKEGRNKLDDDFVVYIADYHPCINDCKPYLRPMSSMTEEEKIEYNIIKCSICPDEADDYAGFVDWLNEHQLDYRGLIEKGLALEAPEGMYNTKIK